MLKDNFSLLQLGSYFSNNIFFFTKLINKNWKHGDLAAYKSDWARNTSIQVIIQVLKKKKRKKKIIDQTVWCLHLSQVRNQRITYFNFDLLYLP